MRNEALFPASPPSLIFDNCPVRMIRIFMPMILKLNTLILFRRTIFFYNNANGPQLL